jgi:hypothetical protein
LSTSRSGDAVARELARRGLSAPALVLLEAHRPLRPLLAMGATFLAPIARPLLGGATATLARTLDSEAEYDEMLDRLRREARG